MPYWQIADETFSAFPIIEPLSIKGAYRLFNTTTVEIISKIADAEIRYTCACQGLIVPRDI
jgi:hypothetical protein